MKAAGLAPPDTSGARRRAGGLFWHRDFRLLWIGQATSKLGSSVTSVALPLVAVAVGNVLKGSFRQTYTPHRLLGRVTVSMQLVNYGTIPLGALLGGALGTAFGIRPAMWMIMSELALTGLILLAGPLHRHRNLPDRPPARPYAAGLRRRTR